VVTGFVPLPENMHQHLAEFPKNCLGAISSDGINWINRKTAWSLATGSAKESPVCIMTLFPSIHVFEFVCICLLGSGAGRGILSVPGKRRRPEDFVTLHYETGLVEQDKKAQTCQSLVGTIERRDSGTARVRCVFSFF
jgi:hypothetical protein